MHWQKDLKLFVTYSLTTILLNDSRTLKHWQEYCLHDSEAKVGKRKVSDDDGGEKKSQCFDRSWCFVYHPDDTPWRVGKSLSTLKKMWLQKSWKKIVICWHSFVHWEFLPEGQTIEAMYQKRYWTALNKLSDADPDPINNWFFLHNNSPSCNIAIMGSFRLTGWLKSFVTHPICLTLLQLTLSLS